MTGNTYMVKFPDPVRSAFMAEEVNQKWLIDFTCLFLTGGDVRCNCTILDLYDRSVIVGVTDRRMMSDLAIRTLEEARNSQRTNMKGVILHSDQGSPYTLHHV